MNLKVIGGLDNMAILPEMFNSIDPLWVSFGIIALIIAGGAMIFYGERNKNK